MQPIFIANWKMNLNLSQSIELLDELLKEESKFKDKLKIIICPSFTSLYSLSQKLKHSSFYLGAQNVYLKDRGSFTGEISPLMLKELKVQYCIVGHSERRSYLKEDDEMINQKIKILVKNNISPILCIGETKKEREQGFTKNKIQNQLEQDLKGVISHIPIFIAYEPVWAIGSGNPVKSEEAKDVALFIRKKLIELYNQNWEELKSKFIILYGGSVSKENIKDFVDKDLIKGVLVGGASQKKESLLGCLNVLVSL